MRFQFIYDTSLHFLDYYLIIPKRMNSIKFESKRELDHLNFVQYLQQLGSNIVVKESLQRMMPICIVFLLWIWGK